MQKEYSFGVIPVYKQEDGKYLFLLIQGLNSDDWFFPKGHIEDGETEIEAASRELMEEAGIKDIDIKTDVSFLENYKFYVLRENNSEITDKTVKLFLGFAQNKDAYIQKSEVKDYKWVTFEEALELIKHEEGDRILKEVNDYLLNS